MLHTLIGDIGHISVIIAFVSAVVASYAYFTAANKHPLEDPDRSWLRFGRVAFIIHSVAVLSIIYSLFHIIYNHYYEYYYAWSHSSNHLPIHFMISCFWEGQEGSFLLWIFWHVVLGAAIIRFARKWEAPVMAVFSFVQLFLVSMILGIVIGDFKLGSSPFILMRDFMTEAPVFQMDPNFVPKDGTGLNPLLQNYWMVIHPPTLFLGFAATLVPFAFAIAGLWKKQYTAWIKPALPWALFAGLVLGVGTMMGAYWAYETLNFGGYWNWDPVENAVYIPWLVVVAAIHTMVLFRRNRSALHTTFILVIVSFILILYATFLTRSGILGNASVHSFTDLGLSGQLFAYLAAFTVLSIVLLVWRWKHIPATEKEVKTYSPDFWIFIGATVLCLGAFQVFATTSIPVYNAFLGFIGIKSNMALPADQIAHYTKFQLWMGVGIAIVSGVGQLVWWKQSRNRTFGNIVAIPFILTMLFASLILLVLKVVNNQEPGGVVVKDISYIILVAASLFAIFANLNIILNLFRKKVSLSGGAVSHIGIALMLLGILFSSGYSHIISQNTSGLLYSRDFPEEINRDNVLLWRNSTSDMGPYKVTYKGQFLEVKGFPDYVNKEYLFPTDDEFKVLARTPIKLKDEIKYKIGDTLEVYPENTYYQVEFKHKESGKVFTLYPRAQVNPEMGLLASPDVKIFAGKDLYTHVSTIPDPKEEKEWSELKEYEVAIGDTLFLNDYIAVLHGIEKVTEVAGVKLGPADVAVQADMKVYGEQKDYHAHPMFVIKDQMVGRIPEVIEDLGLRLMLLNINPDKNTFTLGVNTTQKDYVILKAMEKPFINALWMGTLLMSIGFVMAIVRRSKGLETIPAAEPAEQVESARPVKQVV